MLNQTIPVITIDGPSASGKGTLAQLIASKLGFHYLDSGALYRLVALQTQRLSADIACEATLARIAVDLDVVFQGEQIFLTGMDCTDTIRTEQYGSLASKIAAYPQVRTALIQRQRAFCQLPGLVTDGRDMGSVIFPDAVLKVFLTASAKERAKRRYNQLMEKGINANINSLIQDIRVRDTRDSSRATAPLQQLTDAKTLDTTDLSIQQAVNRILDWYYDATGNSST